MNNVLDRPVVRLRRGFTLIEIMVVVGIMGLLLAMGIPSIIRVIKREGMRKATYEILDVCRNARARAIFSGKPAEVVFHPLDGRFAVAGGGPPPDAPPDVDVATSVPAGTGLSGKLPEGIIFEMLDINLLEYCQSEVARVRFNPNGTSDEMTIILRSDKNERQRINLEVTTGLAMPTHLQ